MGAGVRVAVMDEAMLGEANVRQHLVGAGRRLDLASQEASGLEARLSGLEGAMEVLTDGRTALAGESSVLSNGCVSRLEAAFESVAQRTIQIAEQLREALEDGRRGYVLGPTDRARCLEGIARLKERLQREHLIASDVPVHDLEEPCDEVEPMSG